MSAVAQRRVEDPYGSEAIAADATEDFSSTCLLLLVDERPATAPELCVRLQRLGLIENDADPARVDVLLRELEIHGHIGHGEDRAGTGAVYSLTLAGAQRLGSAADDLRGTQILLDRFLARCGERLVL